MAMEKSGDEEPLRPSLSQKEIYSSWKDTGREREVMMVATQAR